MRPENPPLFIHKISGNKMLRCPAAQKFFIIIVGNKTNILTFGLVKYRQMPFFRQASGFRLRQLGHGKQNMRQQVLL